MSLCMYDCAWLFMWLFIYTHSSWIDKQTSYPSVGSDRRSIPQKAHRSAVAKCIPGWLRSWAKIFSFPGIQTQSESLKEFHNGKNTRGYSPNLWNVSRVGLPIELATGKATHGMVSLLHPLAAVAVIAASMDLASAWGGSGTTLDSTCPWKEDAFVFLGRLERHRLPLLSMAPSGICVSDGPVLLRQSSIKYGQYFANAGGSPTPMISFLFVLWNLLGIFLEKEDEYKALNPQQGYLLFIMHMVQAQIWYAAEHIFLGWKWIIRIDLQLLVSTNRGTWQDQWKENNSQY